MAVYTVHEPPRPAGALAAPERFIFVRDGFYWWAFLLTPLWMLRHRLWLAFVIYLVAVAALDAALRAVGASALAIGVAGTLVSLLIGFEGSTLRRWALRRRRWINAGLVSGDDVENAERRYFDVWVRNAPAGGGAAPKGPPAPPPAPAPPGPAATSGIIGLFPEPGAQR